MNEMSKTTVRQAKVESDTYKAWLESLNLHNRSNRELTLRYRTGWDAGEFSRAGWFYLGNADRVQCISCGGVAREWQMGMTPCYSI